MRRVLKFIFCLFTTRRWRLSWVFSNWYLAGSANSLRNLNCADNYLVHRLSGNRISLDQIQVFHPRLDWLNWVLQNFQFETAQDWPLLVLNEKEEQLLLPIRSVNDVLVLVEVFRDNVYKWEPAGETIMLDFGMNNGIVCLEAAFSGCFRHIYAYELVPDTYNNAIESIALNPALKSKISTFNVGVGGVGRTVDTSMFEAGSIVANIYEAASGPSKPNEVRVLPAGEILWACNEENPVSQIFIKMDIEGAELEVMESLEAYNALGLVNCFIIEWHRNLLLPICEILKRNGFSFRYTRFEANNQMGMIYAFK